MTRQEFLEELRQALQGEISQEKVNDNILYYERYIIEESHKGKTETQVIDQLGSPRLIAKTIIDTTEKLTDDSYTDFSEETTEEESVHRKGFHADFNEQDGWNMKYGDFKLNSWYGILGIILVLFLTILIVGGLFIYLLPVLLPVLLVVLLISLLKK